MTKEVKQSKVLSQSNFLTIPQLMKNTTKPELTVLRMKHIRPKKSISSTGTIKLYNHPSANEQIPSNLTGKY